MVNKEEKVVNKEEKEVNKEEKEVNKEEKEGLHILYVRGTLGSYS